MGIQADKLIENSTVRPRIAGLYYFITLGEGCVAALPTSINEMKKYGFIFFFITNYFCAIGQPTYLPRDPFFQLDSLSRTNSQEKHFSKLYYDFLCRIESQLQRSDTAAQRLVRRFEKNFADFYIDACASCSRGATINIVEWQPYFADTSLQRIQYLLLGTNAHLNGGLWQAIVTTFSENEMASLKKEFRYFKKSLNTTYLYVYNEALANRRANLLHTMTLGLTRWLGNFYLYKWRKRQMKLARLYWQHSPKFQPLLEKVQKKKIKIDKLILKEF